MRVGLVCPYSWSAPGGVQSHVRGLARALGDMGVEARVIAAGAGAQEPGVDLVGATVPVPSNGSAVRVALAPSAGARAVARVRAGGFDVVHVHEPMIPAVSLAVLLAARAPLVGTFHRYADGPGWYRPFAPLCRAALARLDVRVAVSEAAGRHVGAVCPGEYAIVPNGIDAGPEPAPSGAGDTVAFVGRADPRKGLPVLLEAFARLPGTPRLELVGVGSEELEAAAGAVPDLPRARVRAHGRVDDARRRAVLEAADVLCAPATGGESFGIVLAEAMAAGTPVVATRVGGFPDLVEPGAGLLVPPDDPAATAAALARMLASPDLRRRAARAGRARARDLDWSRVARRLVQLYELARARRARRGEAARAVTPT